MSFKRYLKERIEGIFTKGALSRLGISPVYIFDKHVRKVSITEKIALSRLWSDEEIRVVMIGLAEEYWKRIVMEMDEIESKKWKAVLYQHLNIITKAKKYSEEIRDTERRLGHEAGDVA